MPEFLPPKGSQGLKSLPEKCWDVSAGVAGSMKRFCGILHMRVHLAHAHLSSSDSGAEFLDLVLQAP